MVLNNVIRYQKDMINKSFNPIYIYIYIYKLKQIHQSTYHHENGIKWIGRFEINDKVYEIQRLNLLLCVTILAPNTFKINEVTRMKTFTKGPKALSHV
jgi:hypothetical protein